MRIGPWNVNRWKIKRSLLRAAASVRGRPGPSHGRVVVLCYHSIHPQRWIASATPELFEEHLSWLAGNCTCVPFRDIPRRAQSASSERPVVAITFDDGYDDNHEYALPILDKLQVPATFFVTVGLIRKEPEVLDRFHKLLMSDGDDLRAMSWGQIRELQDAGMEIGAHTYSHPNLALCSTSRVRWEFSHSKDVLEQELGRDIDSMAYPFGKPGRHITDETVRIARDVGYEQAGAVLHRGVRSSDSPLSIPRFNTVQDSSAELQTRISGRLDVVGFGQKWAPTWMAKLITPEDFLFDA